MATEFLTSWQGCLFDPVTNTDECCVSFWKLHGILVRRKVVEKPLTNHRQTVENAIFGIEKMLFCIDSGVAKQVRRTKSVSYEKTSDTTSTKRWANLLLEETLSAPCTTEIPFFKTGQRTDLCPPILRSRARLVAASLFCVETSWLAQGSLLTNFNDILLHKLLHAV